MLPTHQLTSRSHEMLSLLIVLPFWSNALVLPDD